MHGVTTTGKKLRFALVGAGRIAQAYVQAFAVTTNAELVAVVDVRHDAAEATATLLNCASYPSYEALLTEGVDIDAAIVATPPVTHAPICMRLLNNGIPVLCEKPVSPEVDSALAIAETALQRGVLFTMASKFRYVQDMVQAKLIMASGELGQIVLVENTFMSQVNMKSRWNSNRRVSGGGVLIDNGTHSIDVMRYLLGPLAEIQVMEGRRTQGLDVEETVRASVRAVSGTIGTMDLSWSLSKETDDYIAIYGSLGTLRVGWKHTAYRQYGREWVTFGSGYDKVQAFRRQIENFSAAIQGLESLLITADDAVASVQAIQAGYAALRNRCWMPVRCETEIVAESAAVGLPKAWPRTA